MKIMSFKSKKLASIDVHTSPNIGGITIRELDTMQKFAYSFLVSLAKRVQRCWQGVLSFVEHWLLIFPYTQMLHIKSSLRTVLTFTW